MKTIWNEYAALWSMPSTDRAQQALGIVTPDVTYQDPGASLTSWDQLSDYMSGFQEAFPGHRFIIDRVVAHHDVSLALWRQVGQNGATVAHGASHAHHNGGRLSLITGFFPTDGT